MSEGVLTVIEIEKKFQRPMWAKYLCQTDKCAINDHTPYYWIDESKKVFKRVTSKRKLRQSWEIGTMFLVVAQYEPVKFKRDFFDEVRYATSLEF